MSLAVIGINHRSAPVAIREQVAFDPAGLSQILAKILEIPNVSESLVVSTCNRTEIYCAIDPQNVDAVADWLVADRNLSPADRGCLYALQQHDAVRHVFSVASGLDSAVMGEPQILGQLKDAYREACDADATGPVLNRLFQRAFNVAKQIRSGTEIGASPVSVAYAAVTLAKRIFSRLGAHTAMLVGAGETIDLTAQHLHGNGLGRMVIANRSLTRARELAMRYDAYAITLAEITSHLAEADIIICSTASPVPLIGTEMMLDALEKRRQRPIFVVDMAVPRDVEAEVADLRNVYLYTVDDLGEVIKENLRSREEAARLAKQIIQAETASFALALQELDAVPAIRELRDTHEVDMNALLDQARRRIAAGEDAETVLNHLARQLTNKFLHQPSQRLRQAGEDGDLEMIRIARQLFGIED